MAPSKLNPQAPEFVPGSRFYGQECSLSDCFSNLSSDDYSEVTPVGVSRSGAITLVMASNLRTGFAATVGRPDPGRAG